MPHVTSIGLDVHARSVAAAAFNPFTGEVVHRDFGTDAAEIAEWALGFEEPMAVSVNLFFTSFAKQAHRSRKGGFTGCANAFSPIPVTA